MVLPPAVSRAQWVDARKELLRKEKELTKARDALSVERRALPMVRVDKEYVFEGPEGKVTLPDLFDGCRQLIVSHFMFNPDWDEGCSSCSAGADDMSAGRLRHLRSRDTAFVYVSRAPLAKLVAYKERKGWDFPWYSSFGSDFNYDFHVTMDDSVLPAEYNYKTIPEHRADGTGYYFVGEQPSEQPGLSCFLRAGGDVFHTYSAYGRGTEMNLGAYAYLDLTALGRQEDWEEPTGRVPQTHPAAPDFRS
ncbi:DUF899 domain-containing protein [Actinosynnema sp. NPDC047251]|uniref:DUF899 domain-containing protein n=1 Tax=Saccharothrix espanaensis (strain ATCC 51144 / DSM 44229 / JCM 9112 / NBRC 15066 / NRRL 15764) TaxID=1179773 RepID=K0K2V0_SACES|nr:DUF899 domain-containing protein [Saccharothrix espanaensis]CCH31194.1 hypothetical protein BN6_39050 [Saccharothrix espanaensis DSM 44229]